MDSPSQMELVSRCASALLAGLATWWLYSAYRYVFLRPLSLLRKLRAQGLPGHPFVPLAGQLPIMMKNYKDRDKDAQLAARTGPVEFLKAGEATYGSLWTFGFGPNITLVVSDPDLVRQLYGSQHNLAMPKQDTTRRFLGILGEGLIMSGGELWQRQRRLLNPALGMQEIKRLYPIMAQCAAQATQDWEKRVTSSKQGDVLQMDAELARLTLRVMGLAAFGKNIEGLLGEEGLARLLTAFADHFPLAIQAGRLGLVLPFSRYIPMSLNRSMWQSKREIVSAIRKIVSARLQAHGTGPQERLGNPKGRQKNAGATVTSEGQTHDCVHGTADEASPFADGGQRSDLLQLMLEATDLEADATVNSDGAVSKTDLKADATVNSDGAVSNDSNSNSGTGDDVAGAESTAPSGPHRKAQASPLMSGPHSTVRATGVFKSGPHRTVQATGVLMSKQQLMDECLNFLGAGFETTANLLTWTMMCLSQHQEWQERAREEAQALCRDKGGQWSPSFEELSELKVITRILQEVLRLYPPASVMSRQAKKDVRINDKLLVPQGCCVYIPIQLIQRNKAFWGADADEFRPDRFSNGVSKAASHPGAFLPFSVGPRVCIGQNFAMPEAKVILGAILCKFSWKLHGSYEHHPEVFVTLRAKRGMPIVLTPLW